RGCIWALRKGPTPTCTATCGAVHRLERTKRCRAHRGRKGQDGNNEPIYGLTPFHRREGMGQWAGNTICRRGCAFPVLAIVYGQRAISTPRKGQTLEAVGMAPTEERSPNVRGDILGGSKLSRSFGTCTNRSMLIRRPSRRSP